MSDMTAHNTKKGLSTVVNAQIDNVWDWFQMVHDDGACYNEANLCNQIAERYDTYTIPEFSAFIDYLYECANGYKTDAEKEQAER